MDGGVRVWSSKAWRERAVSWLDEQLVESAIERTGEVEQPRVRPWATVLTAPTTAGPVWLKATASATAFEVGLYQLLHRVAPDQVLAPLATDPARGWILLPDGGPTLGERATGPELTEAMATALPQYARLQRELAPHVDELLAAGVADMRPARLPERFEQALGAAGRYVARRGDATDREAVDRLAALRPSVAEWCSRLAAAPGPPSIDHNDLHPWNILFDAAGGLAPARFYDWGDAVLAHPFASMLIGLDAARPDELGAPLQAYLAEFGDLAGPAELAGTLRLACRVGRIARALTWDRAVRGGTGADETDTPDDWARAPLEYLLPLLDPPAR